MEGLKIWKLVVKFWFLTQNDYDSLVMKQAQWNITLQKHTNIILKSTILCYPHNVPGGSSLMTCDRLHSFYQILPISLITDTLRQCSRSSLVNTDNDLKMTRGAPLPQPPQKINNWKCRIKYWLILCLGHKMEGARHVFPHIYTQKIRPVSVIDSDN